MRFWNWTSSQANETEQGDRELHLDGVIAESTWLNDDVNPALFKEELNEGTGPISVWINSVGGDCIAAAQIYNMLVEYPGEVTVKIDGIAASAASVIAMAGDTVLMSPVSTMMIHNPATLAIGDHTDMEKAIDMLGAVKDSIIKGDSMFTINDLREKRANLWQEAKTFLDTHRTENGTLSAEDGAAYDRITTKGAAPTADEIIDLVYALKRPYRKNAAFIMNDATLATVRKLKDNTGAYIWQPALTAGEPDRLLGYPVYTSAYAPTMEAGKPVMAFGDFSYYNIGDRGTRSFSELRELFAGNGMVGFVAKERVDGKLILPETVQIMKLKGTANG